jgi:hypothetical protein
VVSGSRAGVSSPGAWGPDGDWDDDVARPAGPAGSAGDKARAPRVGADPGGGQERDEGEEAPAPSSER